MIKIINYYQKLHLLEFLRLPILVLNNILLRYLAPEKISISYKFKKVFGFYPDYNNPKTLNEKIQWLKLNDRTTLHTLCADKFKVRKYIEEVLGEKYLIPLYFITSNLNDIHANMDVEYPLIAKTNHDSGGGIFIEDENVNWCRIRRKLKKRMKSNFYIKSKEWQYKDIEPCVVFEKMLLNENGDIPCDFKIHCFNGSPKYIQVDIDRYYNHKRNIYDIYWNLQPFTWSTWKNGHPLWPNGREIEKPSTLNEMLVVAEKLSKPFFYSRIDLYDVNGKIYFGEITFHPGSGREIIYPKVWDRRLGNMLRLSNENR